MFLWNPKTPPMLKPPRLQDISKNHPHPSLLGYKIIHRGKKVKVRGT
jgi:hypothetical protein